MDAPMSYRVSVDDSHNPKGPDGRGWNRMAIIGLSASARCTLRPTTRQGALDTLRGMRFYGNPTAYDECISKSPCHSCGVANAKRDPWNAEWHLREDSQGRVWLLGNAELGFAGQGYCYNDWGRLMAKIEVPMLKRQNDKQGFYWVAA